MASTSKSSAGKTHPRSLYSLSFASFRNFKSSDTDGGDIRWEDHHHHRHHHSLPVDNQHLYAAVPGNRPTAPEPVLPRTRTPTIFAVGPPSLNYSSADVSHPRAIQRKPVGSIHPPRPYSPHESTTPTLDRLPPGLGIFQHDPLPDLPPPPQQQHIVHFEQAPQQQQQQQQGVPSLALPQPRALPPVPTTQPRALPPVPTTTHNKLHKPAAVPQPSYPKEGGMAPPPPVPVFQQTEASPPVLRKTREKHKGHGSHEPAPHGAMHPHARRNGASPSPEPRARSTSAQPPTSRASNPTESPRAASNPHGHGSRPQSSHSDDVSPNTAHETGGKLHRSWLPGGRSRSNSHDMKHSPNAAAWILSPDNQAEYNVAFLTNGEKVPELWNENGTVYVYLNPRSCNQGPSFKVPAYTVSNSRVFGQLMQADLMSPSARTRGRSFGGRDSLTVDDAARMAMSPTNSPPLSGNSSPGESRLYLPLGPGQDAQLTAPNQAVRQDLERLVALRNLFAFLTGQPLVGTPANPSLYAAFLQVASLLREFDFSSPDGASFGEAATLSFGFYTGQMGLADVRHSREKTIEALVLGEQMRSWELYNEAFAHAVGKYSAIVDIKSPLFEHISMSTRRRLERAHLDLLSRQHNVNTRLEQFDFPSLFAGVGSSTSNTDFRNIRFKNWKTSFGDMRNFVLKYYKTLFGNWPPKARSKKNPFSESGLNRQVLRALYTDLCSLYDLLVDRESITPRAIDGSPDDDDHLYGAAAAAVDPTIKALRKMLSEFDHSSPPVLPPVPFDIPKIPTMCTIKETYNEMAPKDQTRFDKNIQPHEWQLIMLKSHNIDTDGLKTPFLDSFKEFELKEARGKSSAELVEQRLGYWLFLYVVLQSLPMLVVDAPELHFTEGVEYFLCEPPQGNLPWLEDAGEVRKMWYQTAGGTKVELSADVVMYSVEATYYRSYCWLAAKQWEAGGTAPAPQAANMSPLEPPPHSVFQEMEMVTSPSSVRSQSPTGVSPATVLPVRGRSPHRASAYRPSSIAMGLEPVRFEDGATAPAPASNGPRVASLPPSRPQYAHRSASAGNLRVLMDQQQQQQHQQHRHHASGRDSPRDSSQHKPSQGSGSTFDSILQGMDNQKKDKKRSSFLPF